MACTLYSKKKNYNLIIAELLSRRIPHDHETWDDQINSVIEIAKKKRCQDILDVFVNWLKQNLTQEDLDKEMITASKRGMAGLVNGLLTAGANMETRDNKPYNKVLGAAQLIKLEIHLIV